jgi:hypothetical protein
LIDFSEVQNKIESENLAFDVLHDDEEDPFRGPSVGLAGAMAMASHAFD